MLLSDQNRPVIEATLPVVGANIGDIAQRFYRHLFGIHPELLDGTFNRGNQARGEQQQALAGSVAAFATTLVSTPEQVPESLLRRIAHKHASLGIRADQYQVVHDNLMWAIVDVLGDAVRRAGPTDFAQVHASSHSVEPVRRRHYLCKVTRGARAAARFTGRS